MRRRKGKGKRKERNTEEAKPSKASGQLLSMFFSIPLGAHGNEMTVLPPERTCWQP
jgi:hypothetical protein